MNVLSALEDHYFNVYSGYTYVHLYELEQHIENSNYFIHHFRISDCYESKYYRVDYLRDFNAFKLYDKILNQHYSVEVRQYKYIK